MSLLAVPYWRSTLLGIYGVPSEAVDRQRVLLNSAPGGQFRGDADIILCVPSHPEEAVAYQVKRIKVGVSQLRHSAPSKLEELKVAAREANLLADVGFWKVFLYTLEVLWIPLSLFPSLDHSYAESVRANEVLDCLSIPKTKVVEMIVPRPKEQKELEETLGKARISLSNPRRRGRRL